MGIDLLLEKFAADAPAVPPDFPGSEFTSGDRVNVGVPGGRSIVGRVVRPHGGPPATHAVVAPEGGGAHVLAPVGVVRLNTPRQHEMARRRAAAAELAGPAAQRPGVAPRPVAARMPVGVPKAKPGLQEGIALMLEAFTPPPAPTAGETPAQSNAIAASQATAAKASLAAGWNAAKHPRAAGGKFGYTTGGKRATRGHPAKGAASSPRTLNVGSRGALVKSIQRQLNVPQDGVYGPRTKAAVSNYQSQHGLQVDGVIGAQTLAALRGATNARLVRPGPISSRQARVTAHPAAAAAAGTAAPARRGSARAAAPAGAVAPVRGFGGVVV